MEMGLHHSYKNDSIFLAKILVIGLSSVRLCFSNLRDRKHRKWSVISQLNSPLMVFQPLYFWDAFTSIWSMHVVIRDGTVMKGRYLNDIYLDTYATTFSSENLIISMFISPAKTAVLFVSILCYTHSRADAMWDALSLGVYKYPQLCTLHHWTWIQQTNFRLHPTQNRNQIQYQFHLKAQYLILSYVHIFLPPPPPPPPHIFFCGILWKNV